MKVGPTGPGLPDAARLLIESLDRLPDGVVVVNAQGQPQFANPAARCLLGPAVEHANVAEWPARCGLFEADGESLLAAEKLAISQLPTVGAGDGVEICVRRADLAEALWVSMSAAPLGAGDGFVLLLRDCTPRRRAEQELLDRAQRAEENVRKFFRAIEQSPAVVMITDADGAIEYVNPKFTQLTGYSFEEVRGRNPRILKSGYTPREIYQQLWDTVMAGREWCGEFLNRKKNGELYWESASISPVIAADGTITHFIAVKEDITARKQFEQALQQANATLRAVIETAPLGICTLDVEGRVTSWNPAAERMLGWSEQDVVGHPLPLRAESQQADLRPVMDAIRSGDALAGFETRAVRKDGARIEVAIWSAPLHNAKGGITGAVVLLADITQRKWLEEQLRQAQKMEAIGRLAGGVAHDFNNLLTVITGYGELALSRCEGSLREDLDAIMEAAYRATTLTRQLLALSRRQISQPRVVDLNGVIHGMERLLRRALGEDVTLELSLPSTLWSVKADPAHLEQVLLNLAVNARDAMPQGGRLIIATANCKAQEAAALRLPPGQYVRLTVRDTGDGMDPEACRRIFEPFFSTKPRDKGTGLGLSIVYSIVKQCGGEIFVDSQRGEGTVFTIYLPRASGIPQPPVARRPAAPKVANRETILLVEDEEAVRRLVRDTLVRHGYTVLDAADGVQALHLFEQHGSRIDLLLTDVVMPQMSGRELALRLTSRRPDLKVMYMSGYTGDVIADHGVLEPGVILLPKPFSGPVLLRRLREALDNRTERR